MKIQTPVYLQQTNAGHCLFDSQGSLLATFEDWQYAEQVEHLINESQALIEELENKVVDQASELEEMEAKFSNFDDQISNLQQQVDSLQRR